MGTVTKLCVIPQQRENQVSTAMQADSPSNINTNEKCKWVGDLVKRSKKGETTYNALQAMHHDRSKGVAPEMSRSRKRQSHRAHMVVALLNDSLTGLAEAVKADCTA